VCNAGDYPDGLTWLGEEDLMHMRLCIKQLNDITTTRPIGGLHTDSALQNLQTSRRHLSSRRKLNTLPIRLFGPDYWPSWSFTPLR